MSRLALVTCLALCLAGPRAAAQDERALFTRTYCLGCHGPDRQKGDFRIDQLADELADPPARERWQQVLELVADEDMPPSKAPRHPPAAERARFVQDLRADIERADAQAAVGDTMLRRLNRIEHLNSVRDLLGIRGIHLPRSFPEDAVDGAFDTLAEGLYVSPTYLDACLELATEVADRMVYLPDPVQVRAQCTPESWGLSKLSWSKPDDPDGLYFTGINIAAWSSGAIWADRFLAPTSGVYQVRLTVNAEAAAGFDGQPLRLGFYAVEPALYDRPDRANRVDLPRVGELEVTNLQPQELTCEIPLEAGESFHVHCENRLRHFYPDRGLNRGGVAKLVLSARKLSQPTVRIESLSVVGPIGPLPRQTEFLKGRPASADPDHVRSILLPLATRAARRPLTPAEEDELIEPVLRHMDAAPDPSYGIHYGIRRILCSPQFLYRDGGAGPLDDYGLASRLAAFLWSSTPDDKLLLAAAGEQLSDDAFLERLVQRMLADPKAAQFVTHFTGQWLGNRDAASVMVCDVRHTWSELIRYGFLRSTELFFEEVLQQNLSIRTLIDSDFTYANDPMKVIWGYPGEYLPWYLMEDNQVESLVWPEPERVDLGALPAGTPAHIAERGGVLGLSSVLMATADGVESSPILRGVWILDNLFGTPAPPPPANVPALVNDLSKAQSVREILDAHQASTSCSRCHAKIDPLGLAMESFDAIGNWRSEYTLDPQLASDADGNARPPVPVDTAAVMTDGTRLDGPADIKAYLLARPEMFTRCLASKLLEYATGRELTAGDRRVVEQLVQAEPPEGYGLQDLLVAIVRSPVFRDG